MRGGALGREAGCRWLLAYLFLIALLPLPATGSAMRAVAATAMAGDPPGWRTLLASTFAAGRYTLASSGTPVVLPRGIPPLADGRIVATFSAQGADAAGLAARVSAGGGSPRHYYAFWLDDAGRVGATRCDQRGCGLIFDIMATIAGGRDTTLAMAWQGSRPQLQLDGRTVWSFPDVPALSAGAWGLYVRGRARGAVLATFARVTLVGQPAPQVAPTATPARRPHPAVRRTPSTNATATRTPRPIVTRTPVPPPAEQSPSATPQPTFTPVLSPTSAPLPGPVVLAWGWNGSGQLGDSASTERPTLVQVQGLAGVTAIAAGGSHSLALRGDGTVWAWGRNDHGQLGDGTTTNRLTPVQVQGLAGAISIAAGGNHGLALVE